MTKPCEIYHQSNKEEKMAPENISPELIWNEIKHIGLTLEKIERVMANLPCDDLSDRIVRLEEARSTQEKTNTKFDVGIQGAFDIAREAKQETFNKFWKVGMLIFAAGMSFLNGVFLYLIFKQ
jgi:hypothetical protein